jgi:multidrug resistance-associated protein (MRP)
LFHFVTFYASFTLILAQFILSLFADVTVVTTVTNNQPVLNGYVDERTSLTQGDISDVLVNKVDSKTADGNSAQTSTKDCPEIYASFLSRILFYWITKLIWTGYRRELTFSDLWQLRPADRCDTVLPEFEHEWKKELNKHNADVMSRELPSVAHANNVEDGTIEFIDKSRPRRTKATRASIWRAVWRTYGGYYTVGGLFKFIYDIITFLNPLILNKLISFVGSTSTGRDQYIWHGYIFVVAMFVISMLRTIVMQQYWHVCFVTGQRMRSAMIGLIYRKALRLSNSARRTTTVGEIVNLMSVDAQKFQDAPAYMHMIWSTPLTIGIALYMLWQLMGPSVLAGLGAMLLLVPVNAYVANKSKTLQVQQMKYKDARIKLMNEILNGIKVLKLYSWEESFKSSILHIREKELKVLKTSQYLSAVSAVSWFMAPYLVALGTFAVYVLSSPSNILDANKAFVSLSLFNILNYPLSILPIVISYGVQVSVSMGRIIRYLLDEELPPDNINHTSDIKNAIEVKEGTFSWGKMDAPAVKNIDIEISEGSLVAVVGQVGSGKSSLISALCGEMDILHGTVSVKGSVAYVPQQAWIQNNSIRENILFAKEFRQSKYNGVIEACALLPDLEILPGGDQTEVGEKGINLSGGQKQRISLARAVYQNADIYLLDDPLSAVDSHVGKHIFEQVIGPSGLLKNKTRILVTNSVTYLSKMDLIIVLNNGQISEIGTYSDLLSHKSAFAEFILTYLQEDSDPTDPEVIELTHQISTMSTHDDDNIGDSSPVSPKSSSSKLRLRHQLSHRSETELSADGKQQQQQTQQRLERLTEEEAAMMGNVKLAVFTSYLKACRLIPIVAALLWYVVYLATQIGTNIWLSIWSSDGPIENGTTQDTSLRDLRLGVYGGLGIGQALGVFGMAFSTAIACVSSSRVLHADLLASVLRAPMSFFDTTPLGRIVNRLSRDVDTIDVNIPMTMRIWLGTFSGVFTTIFVIAYTTPIFLTVVVPLGLFYYFIQRFYICTSRQLRRIDSVIRSPIYVHFSETVTGVSSIRAYHQQQRFVNKSDLLTDRNQMVNYAVISSNRWMGLWLESIGNLIVFFSGLFAVIQRDSINAGMVGLSVSYALQVTGALNMFVRMTSDMETYIVSVERIKEYVDCPKEAAPVVTDLVPSADWPTAGHVEFINFSVRYRPNLDLVLRDVSCDISPGEKVGIVGRTGAGKSSLTLGLFRIIEAASGSVVIDGVNIANIGLHQLRSKLTIIPQDPVMFSGSLRMNLDPFVQYTDSTVWSALAQAHLETHVRSLPNQLEFICSEGGENLSVGQRQLVCLARALLRKSKILILDEATAAVDLETDDLIQKTIRTTFKNSTVITIAHRLNTILDYDRVLVLDQGQVVEFDSPTDLLSQPRSHFALMARDAGIFQK